MSWLWYIIPSIIGLAALIAIAVVYARKFSKLASLDLEAMPEHRQQLKKSSLVQQRLGRKLAVGKKGLQTVVAPVATIGRKLFRGSVERLQKMEQRYQLAAKAIPSDSDKPVPQASVTKLLQEANSLLQEEKYHEAEKKYIAAIAIDTRSIEAYRGLATVYEAMKDLPHAIATLQFLEQLDPKDENIYRQLGEMYQQSNNYEDAMDAYEQALALGPNNPKNLDPFIEIAILNKLKYKAQSSLDKLKEVNPDNQKLQKYQEQIDQL